MAVPQHEAVRQDMFSILSALPSLCINAEQLMHINVLGITDDRSALVAVRSARYLSSSLRELLLHVDRTVERICEQAVPVIYQQGMESTPAEILCRIFEFASIPDHKAKWPQDVSYALSHVSRRFREISVNIPSMWTYITSAEGKNLVVVRLVRSGLAPIDIHFVRPDNATVQKDAELEQIFEMFLLVAEHWRSFRIDTGICGMELMNKIAQRACFLLQQKGKIRLPLLESLELIHPDLPYAPDRGIYNIFTSWEMPALKSLQTVNIIPQLGVFGDSLTSVSHTFNVDDPFIPVWDFKPLLDFLLSLPNLLELHLGLDNLRSDASFGTFAVLQSVRRFTLTCTARYLEVVDDAMRALCFPNLTHFKAAFTPGVHGIQPESCIRVLFPQNAVYTRLTDFELILHTSDFDYNQYHPEKANLSLIFASMPNLLNLTLEMPDIFLSNPAFTAREMRSYMPTAETPDHRMNGGRSGAVYWSEDIFTTNAIERERAGMRQAQPLIFPSLRSVHLRRCHNVKVDILKDVYEQLRRNGDEGAFERVVVENCARIGRGDVLEIIPAEKVIWSN